MSELVSVNIEPVGIKQKLPPISLQPPYVPSSKKLLHRCGSELSCCDAVCSGDDGQRRLLAQDATEFQAYHLSQSTPAEARRMLTELLGTEAGTARLVADVENSNLLVSGSPAVQQLAKQLVQQMNAAQAEQPVDKAPVMVRAYTCDPRTA